MPGASGALCADAAAEDAAAVDDAAAGDDAAADDDDAADSAVTDDDALDALVDEHPSRAANMTHAQTHAITLAIRFIVSSIGAEGRASQRKAMEQDEVMDAKNGVPEELLNGDCAPAQVCCRGSRLATSRDRLGILAAA